jgi:hypothetical protein
MKISVCPSLRLQLIASFSFALLAFANAQDSGAIQRRRPDAAAVAAQLEASKMVKAALDSSRRLLQKKNYAAAEAECQRAILLANPDPMELLRDDIHCHLGAIYVAEGSYELAIRELEPRTKSAGVTESANLALAYVAVGRTRDAWLQLEPRKDKRYEIAGPESAYLVDRARDGDPDNLKALALYLRSYGEWGVERMEDLRQALKLLPQNPSIAKKLADALMEDDSANYQKAEPYLNIAINHFSGELKKKEQALKKIYASRSAEAQTHHSSATGKTSQRSSS